ncbi:MAG: hypothetical protein Q4F12_04205 [Erysipelotrichaceae bacterium]|nr:hypothetical protein [Erysipelotrichaceae bacterium]
MNKKEYLKPSIDEVIINSNDLIRTSDDVKSSTGGDNWDDE